jgi:hypothetical protein
VRLTPGWVCGSKGKAVQRHRADTIAELLTSVLVNKDFQSVECPWMQMAWMSLKSDDRCQPVTAANSIAPIIACAWQRRELEYDSCDISLCDTETYCKLG